MLLEPVSNETVSSVTGTFIIISTFLLFYFQWRPESSDHTEVSRFAQSSHNHHKPLCLYLIGPESPSLLPKLLGFLPGHSNQMLRGTDRYLGFLDHSRGWYPSLLFRLISLTVKKFY